MDQSIPFRWIHLYQGVESSDHTPGQKSSFSGDYCRSWNLGLGVKMMSHGQGVCNFD
jgi:hypothetical protein